MISDYIDQVQRAQLFRAEPERIRQLGIERFEMRGESETDQVYFGNQGWQCTCRDFIRTNGRGHPCPHVIAMYRLLNDTPELAA